MYFLAFPNDPRWTQILVYGVYTAEFVQTILITQTAFRSFAPGFGNIESINEEGNLWFTIPIMSSASACRTTIYTSFPLTPCLLDAIVACVVQVFYAYRLRILAQSYIVPVIIVVVRSSGVFLQSSYIWIFTRSSRLFSWEAELQRELSLTNRACSRSSWALRSTLRRE